MAFASEWLGKILRGPIPTHSETKTTENPISDNSKITQKEFLTLEETKKKWMDKNGVKYWQRQSYKDPCGTKTYKQNIVRLNKAMDTTLIPLTPSHKRVFGVAFRRTQTDYKNIFEMTMDGVIINTSAKEKIQTMIILFKSAWNLQRLLRLIRPMKDKCETPPLHTPEELDCFKTDAIENHTKHY